MATFNHGNAKIYFEDNGHGDPIIAIPGLIETTRYWGRIADRLIEGYRFIPMDMRGHGRSVVKNKPYGFDDVTIGSDIIALADHLKLDRFHLLCHSTGGFAAVRYAMKDSSRFATLILTDTSSATSPIPGDPETVKKFFDAFGTFYEKNTWDQIIEISKKNPAPFFRGIMDSDRSDELMEIAREIFSMNDRNTIAAFVRSFYTDPDPRVEGLRKIKCPVLIIYGEKDDLFIKSSKVMADEIPGAKILEYPGAGHMTAFETPDRLASDIIEFIRKHPL